MSTDFPRARRPSELSLHEADEYVPSDEQDLGEPGGKDQRSPYERDRDKILYCRAFRRLKDVTQVARAGETYLHHDRLTHSLKVAQVGQRLSELLLSAYEDHDIPVNDYLDPNVVEAACLAHDLGHPPFGHLTEKLLDKKVREETSNDSDGGDDEGGEGDSSGGVESDPGASNQVIGYEGNAQSFRIVTNLVPSIEAHLGLDLTRATLNAIQKYPWERDADLNVDEKTDKKWGCYPTEQRYFDFARQPLDSKHERTLEAEIMDFADDLTYAIHDVDDFYRDGLIPFDKLLREAKELVELQEAEGLVEPGDSSAKEVNIDTAASQAEGTDLKAFEEYLIKKSDIDLQEGDAIRFFIELVLDGPNVTDHFFSPYDGTEEEQRALNQFVSAMIARYLEALQETAGDRDSVYLERSDEDSPPTLEINSKFRREIDILKQLTFYYVISNPTLAAQQRGEEQIINELFDVLYEEADPDGVYTSAIPVQYRERVDQIDDADDPLRARIVADMIAAMTEPQAITLHKRLVGRSPGSLQDEIMR